MPRNIDDVLHDLDTIIALEQQRCSFRGYFAAMYRATTLRVKQGVEAGAFDDAQRMVEMDVRFADYYLRAWRQNEAGDPGDRPTKPWRLAFESAQLEGPLIVQHMLLGMNAHINLDLPQAAVETAGADLGDFQNDFMQINAIIKALLDEVQAVIDAHSPYMDRLDVWGGNKDEAAFSWSVNRARDAAWFNTLVLGHLPGPLRSMKVRQMELSASALARVIRATPMPEVIRVSESDWRRPSQVAAVIQDLWDIR